MDQQRQDFIQKFVQAGKNAGASKDEVIAKLKDALPQYDAKYGAQAQPQTQPQSNPLGDLLSSIAKPFVQTGKTIGGAGFELARATDDATGGNVAHSMGLKGDYVANNNGDAVQNPFLSMDELQKYHDNPNGAMLDQAKASAGVASWAVPFGEGANIATKAILPGAAAGALQGASQDNASLNSILSSAVGGAAGAGLLHGAGQLVAPIANKAGSALENLGLKSVRSQYVVKPTSAVNKDIMGTMQKLQKYGVSNPDEMQQIASVVTGPDGVVNQLKQQAIAKSASIDTAGVEDIAKSVIDKNAMLKNSRTGKNFMQIVKDDLQGATAQDATGVTTGTNVAGKAQVAGLKDPTQIFKIIQQHEGQASELSQFGASADERALAQAHRTFANELKDKLFGGNGAGVNSVEGGADMSIPKLTPDQYKQLHDISPQLAQDVSSATTIKQLRAIESPFVRASQLANESIERRGSAPVDLLDVGIGGLGGLHPATLAALGVKKYLNSNMGRRQVGTGMIKAGQMAKNASPVGSKLQQLLDLVSAKGGAAAGGSLGN